ncbi:MAG: sulfite exporter TauE/SafE family protein [Coriobacteriia bacterium]|nr:sulfite exporter TauE/SafE family protein [Coriobacteriia bacterium]
MFHFLIGILPSVGLGLVSGVLSGMFGIGGGVITTPGIRLLLGGSAMSAVATPLVGIVPSSLTGAYNYLKKGVANWRIGIMLGGVGACFSAFGALAANHFGGKVVMVGTVVLILYAATDTIVSVVQSYKTHGESDVAAEVTNALPISKGAYLKAGGIGAFAGVYSGFFGLGGGFVIVPLLRRLLKMDYHEAIGTSLLSVAMLSIPGLITHSLLGNVDWMMGAGIVVGVIPGAALGAKITLGTSERATSIGFAILLIVTGIWLGSSVFLGI